MKDLIREAPLGQVLRLITRNKILRYPEEEEGFKLPEAYKQQLSGSEKPESHNQPRNLDAVLSAPPGGDGNSEDSESLRNEDDVWRLLVE